MSKERIITDTRQTDKLLSILQGIRRGTMNLEIIHRLEDAIDIVIGVDKCNKEIEQ
jgi:hypothetical protein